MKFKVTSFTSIMWDSNKCVFEINKRKLIKQILSVDNFGDFYAIQYHLIFSHARNLDI